MKRLNPALAAMAAMTALAAIPLQAQETAVAGDATYIQTGATTTALPNGGARVDATIDGYVLTDDTSHPVHLVAQDCASTNLMDAYGNLDRSAGYCASRDAEGDMFWIWFWNGSDGGEWGVINGTGKFEGMTGGGTSVGVAADPDGRFAIRWEGTFNMQ